MKIELRTVDEGNRTDVESLEVSESQRQYIASNEKSIKTALSEEHKEVARPFAIYADERLVGFTMFAFELESPDPDDRYWLWRFMIDQNEQGKGYGQAALAEIIRYFEENGADRIFLSTEPENECGVHIYHKAGFVETGDIDDGEAVMKLMLPVR